ncbi:mesoderm posterior protein 1-like [Leucoraja erinacea]|uniref:mesoderm posterior protein 1-like n=1 Tax=Leucoraja erinaceus TaxID=7782 RepID=UPI0024539F88|nr:mesoderm posterior protein 1-like [Leucoraja erinacea]
MDMTVVQPQGCPIARGHCRRPEWASAVGCGPDPPFTDWSTGEWAATVLHRSMLADGARPTSQSHSSPTDYSLSPISSVHSCCRLSPPHVPGTSGRTRKVGPRCVSGQRQSASEREKLRMRGLAKALRNLRTYLPPSVAPAAQSLTKLETLRLTTRYIAHLTDVLALGEQMPAGGPTGTALPTLLAASPCSLAIIPLPSATNHPPATVT